MTASLTELYQDPALRERAACQIDIWRQGSVGRVLERVGPLAHIAGAAAMATELDNLIQSQYDPTPKRIASLLGSLPGRTLLENFGEEVMGWTLANDSSRRAATLGEDLEQEGYDRELLHAACILSYRTRGDRDLAKPISGKEVLAQNAVMELVLGGGLHTLDVPALLAWSALPDISISGKRARDYALLPVRTDPGGAETKASGRVSEWQGKDTIERHPKAGQGLGLWYDMWLDTFAGVLTTYKGAPQMLVGVCAGGTNEVLIAQMQRLHGRVYDPTQKSDNGGYDIVNYKPPRGLMPLDWPKLAVGIAAQLATRLGMRSVGIQRGSAIPSAESNISTEHAIEIYDGNAERLFFVRGENRDWHKSVSELI